MAEKACHAHALCVALTYSDDTQDGRDAAQFFNYQHVRAFIARLRSAVKRKDPEGTLRFICAGEQGDQHKRCHWHIILFSSVDLTALGDVTGRYGPVDDRREMLTLPKRERRLHWSMWPFGFVTFQEPDEGGMAYVLSYCLKDQFAMEKAEGTGRAMEAENFATGLFRMSKRPSIGEAFLYGKLSALADHGQCLPSLNIKIPGFRGFWQPSGLFRKKLLWGLVALNQRAVWTRGAPAPQWSALILACQDNDKDMEILLGKAPEDDAEDEWLAIVKRQKLAAADIERGQIAGRCGGDIPCLACLNGLSAEELATLDVERVELDGGKWAYRRGALSVAAVRRRGPGINPFCGLKGTKRHALVFPETGRDA